MAPVLVPDLRPLSVGEIIDVAIKIWRRNLATLAKIVFVVVAPVQILSAPVTASVSIGDTGFETFDAAGNSTLDTRALAAWAAGMFTAQVLSMLAFLVASAAVLRAVSVAYLGGTPDWKESLRAATGRLRSLLWVGFVTMVALFGAAIALFVPAIWLGVSWSVAFPVMIAEGERGTNALRRSFRLVRGRWWQVLGALALAFMFQAFVGLVLGIPLGFLMATWDSNSVAALVLTTVVSVASSVITTPFMSAVLVLIYFDLRVRKEGFDLQLLSQGVGIESAVLSPSAPWAAGSGWGTDSGYWGAGTEGGAQWGGGPQWGGGAQGGAQWGGGPPPGNWGNPPGGGWAPPGSSAASNEPPPPPSTPPSPSWEEPIDPTGGWGPPPEPTEREQGGEPGSEPGEEPLGGGPGER